MNLSNEQRQRETDRQGGLWEARQVARERFFVPPLPEPAPSLLRRAADEASEIHSEGRVHRNTRTQRHE